MRFELKKNLSRRLFVIALTVVVLAIALAAGLADRFHATTPAGQTSVHAAAGVSGRRGQVIKIDAGELRRLMQMDPNLYLVDVRSDKELQGPFGRIPHSIHIPLQKVMANPQLLPENKTLVFICEAGVRSIKAARAVASHGRVAYSVKGGMRAWHALKGVKSTGSIAEPRPAFKKKRPSDRGGSNAEEPLDQDMGC